MRGILEPAALAAFAVAYPGRIAQVPIGEPKLFCFYVLLFRVEDAVVRDEAFETLVVVSGEPVNAVTAEACAHCAEAFPVYVGFGGDVVDRREIVLHAQAVVVAADFFQPFHAEAGQAAAVRGYHNVAVGCHDLEIPTVAPELADGRLRAALAEEEHGVFLSGVELGGIDHPAKFLLPVHCIHPAFLHLTEGKLPVKRLVLLGQSLSLYLFAEGDGIDFVRAAHAVALGDELLAVRCDAHEGVVAHVVGELLYVAFEVGHVDIGAPVPHAGEVNLRRLGVPAKFVHAALERLCHELLLARGEFHDAEPRAVALISVALHAEPREVAAVGRELRVLVVAHERVFLIVHLLLLEAAQRVAVRGFPTLGFAYVAGCAVGGIIYKYVAVGADGIVAPCLFTAGIGNGFRVGAPRQLLYAAKRHHRALEGLAGEQIRLLPHPLAVERRHEGVRRGGDIRVPVLIHQVVDHHARCFGQVFVVLLNGGVLRHFVDKDHLLAVGRKQKVYHVRFGKGDLPAAAAVEVHFPELALAVGGGEVGDTRAVLNEGGAALAACAHGEQFVGAGVRVEQVYGSAAAVLLHAVIGHGVGQRFAVGRLRHAAYAPHCPKVLGSHQLRAFGGLLLADNRFVRRLRSGVRGEAGYCECHKKFKEVHGVYDFALVISRSFCAAAQAFPAAAFAGLQGVRRDRWVSCWDCSYWPYSSLRA